MSDFTGKLIRGTMIVFTLSLVASLAGYLIRLLLAKQLTPTEFGLFYAVFSFISVFIAFRNLGVSPAVAKFIAEYRVRKNWQAIKNTGFYYFFIESAVYILMALVFLVFARTLAAAYFNEPSAPELLTILTFAFGFSLFESLYLAAFQGFNSMLGFSLLHVLRNLFVFVAAWLFLGFGLGVEAPAYAYLVAYALTGLFGWFYYGRLFTERKTYSVTKDIPLLKRMFGFGIPVAFGHGAASALSNVDTIVLTSFRSLEEVGWYNTALPTSNLIRNLFRSVATTLFPLSSEMDAEGNKRFGKDLTVVYKYSFALALPMAVGLASLAPEVLRIFFGEAYVPAAPALMILAGATLFSTLLMIPSNVLMGIGAVVPNSTILIIGSVLTVLLDLALVPVFGIVGAATANASSQLVMMLACQSVVRKKIEATIPWWAYARTLLAGVSIPFVILIIARLGIAGIPKLVLGTLLGGIVYFGFIWLFRVIRFGELVNMVRSALKKPSKHVENGST